MAILYVAEPVFRFTLISGAFPDCESDPSVMDALREIIIAALTREGHDFAYADGRGGIAQASVDQVYVSPPCGDQDGVADVTGSLSWYSTLAPEPDLRWELGDALADWFRAVRVESGVMTCSVAMVGLSMMGGWSNPGGTLWPMPGTVDGLGADGGGE